MADAPQAFYSIQYPEQGMNFSFESPEALLTWAQQENNAWSTVIAGAPARMQGNILNSFNRAKNLLTNLFVSAERYAREPANSHKDNLDSQFREAFVVGSLPIPMSAARSFLQTVKEKCGERTMQAALAAMVSPPTGNIWGLELSDTELRAGFVAGSLYNLGMDPFNKDTGSHSIQVLTSRFETEIEKARSANEKYAKNSALALATFAETANQYVKAATQDFDITAAEFDNEGRDNISLIRATEATYREHMKLRAPTEYWIKKSGEHKGSAKKWGIAVAIYAVLGSAVLILGLWELTRLTLPTSSADPSQYFRTAGIGLVASTIMIWIGRVLLRLFLSERHLATDADERVTLVMTYLALTQDGKIEPADRPIVLAPLFRAASDGIVKDDGAPESSLGGILTRGLSGPR